MSKVPIAAVTLVGSERPDVPCFSATVANGLKQVSGSQDVLCRFNLAGEAVDAKFRKRDLLFVFEGEVVLVLDSEDGDRLSYRQIVPALAEPKIQNASWKAFFGADRPKLDETGCCEVPTTHLLLRKKDGKTAPVGSVIPVAALCLTSSVVPEVAIYSTTVPTRPLVKSDGRWKCRFMVGGKPVDTSYGDSDILPLVTGDRLLRLVKDGGNTIDYQQFYPSLPDPPNETVEWATICGKEREKKTDTGKFEPLRESFTVLRASAKKFEPVG